MVPLQNDLKISVDAVTSLTLVPSAGSLLTIFLIGTLGDRIGKRPIIVGGAMCYMLGAVLMMAAANMGMALAGRLFGGIGAITLVIMGLASLSDAVRDDAERGRVFGYFAALTPATFITGALLAALISQFTSWRLVPLLWLALGAVILLRIRTTSSGASSSHSKQELLTPLLAGVALAGLGLAFTSLSTSTTVARLAIGMAAVAVIALVIALRAIKQPTLDLRILRVRGTLIIVLAILFVTSTNLFFYVNIFLQYRFAVPLWELWILMTIPQLSAVAGGLVGGRLSARIGSPLAASAAIAVSAVATLGFLLVRPGSSPWVPVAVLTLVALPNSACVGPLTQSLLDRAPEGGSGAASSIRSAAWSLGAIIGGVVVGAFVYRIFTSSLSNALVNAGLAVNAAEAIAERVRSGEFVAEIAEQLRVTAPKASAELLSSTSGLTIAQMDAVHVLAIVGFIVYLLAAVLMVVAYFRRPLAQNATVGVKI